MSLRRAWLQQKLQLYRNCYELTIQIGKAVEDGDGEHALRLLKRRDVIFHRIREGDAHPECGMQNAECRILTAAAATEAPAINELIHQMRDLIGKIILADGALYKQMAAKRMEIQHALNQTRHKRRLALAYHLIGAKTGKLNVEY
jgi:hypothetical protein